MAAVVEFETQPVQKLRFPRGWNGGVSVTPPVVSLLTAVILVVGLFVMSGALRTVSQVVSGAHPSSATMPVRSGSHVVVGPGDTLRSIAVEYAPTADQARVVDAIQALNGGELSVEVGQVLALPLLEE